MLMGVRTGSWIEWHLNGKVSQEANLVDGQLDGVQKAYYSNGQLSRMAEFKAGTLPEDIGVALAFFGASRGIGTAEYH